MKIAFFCVEKSDGFCPLESPSSLKHRNVPEKPDSQLSDKIKEDEVSSSEEVFKSDCSLEKKTEKGKQKFPTTSI